MAIDWSHWRRRRRRSSAVGRSAHYRIRFEQLESRQLLSVSLGSARLSDDAALISEPMAEGEAGLPDIEIESLSSLSVSTGTGYKAQSKVWQHDGHWWAAVGGGGTKIWRLDGSKWTAVLTLTSTAYRTDVKSDGDLVHVLLFPDGPATKLVSAEYVPSQKTYKLWSQRPEIVDVPLSNGVRLATLDIDSSGRMWVVADTTSTIQVHYSDPESNYATWNGPITIGTGIQDGDISVVTTLRNGSIGILWSNQVADRFLFREHFDFNADGSRKDPTQWEPVEVVAEEAALNVGGGMADDHLHVAVAADGTLYASVKTSYDRSGYTKIGVLVRRPNGEWDPELYHVSYDGTRPIIVLNDTLHQLMVFNDDEYHVSSTKSISFGPALSVNLGSNVTSTKQNWVDELVVLGGGKAVRITTDAVANEPPTAVPDSYRVNEDQSLVVTIANGVLKNDTDADGNSLTAIPMSDPAHGTLDVRSDGSFTYVPTGNFFGVDTFTYQASDGLAASNVTTVTITVEAVNDAPLVANDSYSTEENLLLVVDAAKGLLKNDSDIDGDALQASLVETTAHGTLTVNSTTGAFEYQPNANFAGVDTFTYQAFDGIVKSAVATVTIHVNARPRAGNNSYAVEEDQTLQVPRPGVLQDDVDDNGDPLTAELLSDPQYGMLEFETDGSFTYRPHPNFHGVDSFTYAAHDGIHNSLPATVSIQVHPVNDSPLAVSDSYSMEIGQSLVVRAAQGVLSNDSDPDGDPLQARLVTDPGHGILQSFLSSGSFTYVPADGFEGFDRFTYVSHDAFGDSAITEVEIQVVNPAIPIVVSFQDGLDGYSGTRDTRIRSDQATTNFGDNKKLELDGSPDQVSLLRWDISSIPTGSQVLEASLTVNIVTTSLQDFEIYEALRAWDEFSATFLLAATDQPWEVPGAAGPQDHAASVLGKLVGPSLGLVTIPLNEDGIAVIQKWIADPASNHGIVIQDLADSSTDDLDFSAREQKGLGPKLTVTYRQNVPPPPPPPEVDPPTAESDSYTVDEDGVLEVSAALGVLQNDIDPAGVGLEAVVDSGPTSGQLHLNPDGSFTYAPAPNFSGVVTFSYLASDGTATSDVATVTITVEAVNDAPSAENDSYSTDEDLLLTVEAAEGLLKNDSDIDGDLLQVSLVDSPAHGTLTVNSTTGSFEYQPNANFSGIDSFTYQAFDGIVKSAMATVTIQVNARFRADNDSYKVDEDQTLEVPGPGVLQNDTSFNNDPLTAVLLSEPQHGTLEFESDGSFTYRPQSNFHGDDSFTYAAHDGIDSSLPVTVSIQVNPVNDFPLAVPDRYSLGIDQSLVVDASQGVLSNDADPDDDPLQARIITDPSHGVLQSFLLDGSFTYVPADGFEGVDKFTYVSRDASSDSAITEVEIQVVNTSVPVVVSLQDGLDGYAGTRDTRLRADLATTNFGHHTKLELDGSPDQVGLIRWDISTIPAGSTVLEVSLTINVVRTSEQDYEIYEALRAWDEESATFLLAATDQPWEVPGAAGPQDHAERVLGKLVGPSLGLVTIPLNEDGIAVVQKWISDPTSNHGIVIQDLADSTTDDLDFSSREQAGLGPKLTVTYRHSGSLPPPPPPPPPEVDPPSADPDSYAVNEDGVLAVEESLGVLRNDVDPAAGGLQAIVDSNPSFGDLHLNANGAFTYTPHADFHGEDVFWYRVEDSLGRLSAAAAVTINVTSQNDVPEAEDLQLATLQDAPISFDLFASDRDGDQLSFSIRSLPQHGDLVGTAPALTYQPATGFVGDDSFTFEVDDGFGGVAVGTISITVTPASEPETWSFQNGLFPQTGYDGTEDASVRGDDPDSNFASRTSLWLDGSPDQGTFIRWDLTTLPTGTIVHAATITVQVVTESAQEFELYEMLTSWSESEVTYTNRMRGAAWEVAGAQGSSDRGSIVLGTIAATGLTTAIVNLNSDGIAAVQRWIDDPTRNFGFVFQNFDNARTDDLDFASSEAKVIDSRPKLSLQVTLPATSTLVQSSLRNLDNPLDVDGDTYVAPSDVRVVINTLNEKAEGEQAASSAAGGTPPRFPDVSGDGFVTPLDALLVINYLTAPLVESGGEGEGVGAVLIAAELPSPVLETVPSPSRRIGTESRPAELALARRVDVGRYCDLLFAHTWGDKEDAEDWWQVAEDPFADPLSFEFS